MNHHLSRLLSTGLALLLAGLALSGCSDRAPLGTKDNPIKLFFTPSVEAKTMQDQSEIIREYLEAHTPYKFQVAIPASYVAVVESFGTKRADVAVLNTFGYLLANEKYGVQARLKVIRYGLSSYRSQIIVRADRGINSIKDLQGKRFAFVDPVSASGYLLPYKYLHDHGVTLGDTVFAQKHDNVVTMVYQGQVDAGATFYSPPENGHIEDARRLVLSQFPDVAQKVKILALTDEIPNDPVAFRKGLPEEMKRTIANALVTFVHTPAGRRAFTALYDVTDLTPATDADYDSVRNLLKLVGKSASDMVK